MPCRLFPPPGPTLPPFETLLVKGPYPPSAPLHLCLSHLNAEPHSRKALFLTPRRQAFAAALEEFNDHWLTTHVATGEVANSLAKINVFYPPSPSHWSLLLSLLKPLTPSSTSSDPRTVLNDIPSLIVLHEPSMFFLDAQQDSYHDISQYLLLVTNALAAASFLSSCIPCNTRTISVVLFDSSIGTLKLPLLRPSGSFFVRTYAGDEREAAHKMERVDVPVERYFEWVALIEKLECVALPTTPLGTQDTQRSDNRTRRMILKKTWPSTAEDSIVWEWTEVGCPRRSEEERVETTFEWGRI